MLAKKSEERRRKMVWQNAMYDASMQSGHLRINNTKLEHIDPMAYDFYANFGFHMISLRLVGVELKDVAPEIGNLVNLEILSLANNQIITLPDSLSNLTKLKELYLMYNQLIALPERIGNIVGLEKIGITNNKLESLPVTFGALKNLERVDLECNCLTVLPENLHEMLTCTTLVCNNNKLIRLPRCIGRMPSLTHLSASNNQIAYIPLELFSSKTLKVLRLNVNKIEIIPEHIGDVITLREVSIDYNEIHRLPLSFYKLVKLKILRIEGNAHLLDPPPDVVVRGGAYVVNYCREKFMTDKTSRMRQIILTTQALLHQITEREIADPAHFEPNILLQETDLDTWTAVSIGYLFNELLPMIRQIWLTERDNEFTAIIDGNRKKYNKGTATNPKDFITEYSFTEREVLWAYSNFSDVAGPVLKKQQVNFTKCCCVNPEDGKRRPCIPPKVGYMCRRESVLLKNYIVRARDKEERDWQAYKANGINDAIIRAEAEAKAYLESQEGSLWLENVAYEQAEDMLVEQGANKVVMGRHSEVEKKKAKVIARFDKKKRRVIKSRDEKMKVLEVELERYKADRKVVKEGYMRNAIESKINELTHKIANLPEHQELAMLQEECERECQIVEDNLFDNDSDDSMNTSEAERSDPYSTDDSSPECQAYQYRLKRYWDRKEEEKKFKELKERYRKENKKEIKGTLSIGKNIVKKFIIEGMIEPAVQSVTKTIHKAHKKVHKEIRHIREVSQIRTRKILHKLNGNFDEIQRELKYEIYHQYVTHQIHLAREKAKHEFSVIDTVRHNMQGKGTENAFKAWVKWVYTKKQRIRRDIRRQWKTATKAFDAAMLSVTSAQAQVDMWFKGYDIYSDRPFWQHSLTNDVTYDKPGIQHFLPANYHIPEPPGDLPPDIPFDTSSDESDSNWQRRREAEREARAELKRQKAFEEKKAAAARAAELQKLQQQHQQQHQQYVISSDSDSDSEEGEGGGEESSRSASTNTPQSRRNRSRSSRGGGGGEGSSQQSGRRQRGESFGVVSNSSTVSTKPSVVVNNERTHTPIAGGTGLAGVGLGLGIAEGVGGSLPNQSAHQAYHQLLPIDNVETAMMRDYERQEEASQQSGMSTRKRQAQFSLPTFPSDRVTTAPAAAAAAAAAPGGDGAVDDNDIFRSIGRPDRRFEAASAAAGGGEGSGGNSVVMGNLDLAAAAGIDIDALEEQQQSLPYSAQQQQSQPHLQQHQDYSQEYAQQYSQEYPSQEYNQEYYDGQQYYYQAPEEGALAPAPPSTAAYSESGAAAVAAVPSGLEVQQYFYDPATGQSYPYTPTPAAAAGALDDQGSIGTTVTDDNYYENVPGIPAVGSGSVAGRGRVIRSMSIDTSSASIYTKEYLDVLHNTAPGELINFGTIENDNDEEYRSVMEESGSVSGASSRLLEAAAKARHYMATSEHYKNRKNITLPEVDMSNLSEVLSSVDKQANNEYELAYKAIRKKRNQLNPVRHHLYMAQMNRKPKSFEMIKAEQQKAAEEAEKAHQVEIMEGVFIDDRETEKYIAASDEELLRLAGGNKQMILDTSKAGTELKSILAQRALHVRRRLKERAIEQKLLPPKSSFYKREVLPFFTGNYHGSSSDEEEEEEELRKQKEEQREKRRLARAEKNAIKAKLLEKATAAAAPQEEVKPSKSSKFTRIEQSPS